ALACSWCEPDQSDFLEMQADYLVRTYPRILSEKITGIIWYRLDGPGWYLGGMLDDGQHPKPVYYAYKYFLERVVSSTYSGKVDYGTGIEGYSFVIGNTVVHIVYTHDDIVSTITVPRSEFIAAHTRDGEPITPTTIGDNYSLIVHFEPIYITRKR
ncbi:MAG: hypothetical protein JW726_07970, partial [Anaerolineales bacterium]|nr:hypothetical protein [Anaerolineales bacterium]